jgi:mxaJ protein
MLFGAAVALPAAPAPLRVCSDPNNLPFSNVKGEGFENRIAELVARESGTTVAYTWWPQRRGFFRHTLDAGLCDVVMGVPAEFDDALATAPYYRSTYVFVTRADRDLSVRSFDDARLRSMSIGLEMVGEDYANAPPAHALARRGIFGNVVGFSVFADYSQPNPPARVIDAVAAGRVDIGLAWGPLAGYFARREPVPLRVTPVSPPFDGPYPFTFAISMAVRKGDAERRRDLDRFIASHREDIERILAEYGVPRAPEPPAGGSGR